jgi:ribonuclease BN (tRNA processing enzyme)
MTIRLALFGLLALVMSALWASTYMMWRAAEVGELVQTLEPRSFPRLTVLAVGTGGAYENRERLGPSTGIGYGERVLLVDAGRGVSEALRTSGVPVSQPDTVLLTNLLPLNTVGLDDLLLTGWRGPRETPIRLIGPPGTIALAEALMAGHARGIEAEASAMHWPLPGARFEAIEVGGGWSEEVDGLKISAGAISGGPLPALAWRFEAISRSVVVSGTGWSEEQLGSFAQGANMLVTEAVLLPPAEDAEEAGVLVSPERLQREADMHTSLYDVGALATRAGVDTLVLIKLRQPPFFDLQITSAVNQTYDGSIELPADGDEYTP